MWKILIVEDSFTDRQFLVEMLRGQAECDIAVNGGEGVEAYNRSVALNRPYDVILLDIAMPDINGMEFLTMVRDNEAKAGISPGEGIPIIMVTVYKESFMEAFNRGCDDYILKPVNAPLLLGKIRAKVLKNCGECSGS